MRRPWLLVAAALALLGRASEASSEEASCDACRLYAAAFLKRLDATARGADGQVDLAQVHARTCEGVGRGERQCTRDAARHRTLVDRWWHEDRAADLSAWLCDQQLKVCCPAGHFGPECAACGAACSGNGRCRGEGSRGGDGSCACEPGYGGAACAACLPGFFESFRDASALICSACFAACRDACRGPGPLGCAACRDGWHAHPQLGCQDVNECVEFTGACALNQFCVNTEGAYSCLDCDRACKSCNGDGPDMCDECAEGYVLKEGSCVEARQQQQSTQATLTRYATYAGLCVATFIIFNKNMLVAMVVGAAVSIYITVAEYMYGDSVSLAQLAQMLKLTD